MSCNGSGSSDQACPYPYQVLDAEQRQIRVLTLLPGNWHDPISCELRVVPLNDDPAYFALSHVWGDPKVTLPIFLHKHALQVTSNLENALRRLRGPTKPMVIWIDALCIYSHRTTMNYFESLRFVPQFFEGFNFTHLASQIWQYIRLRFQYQSLRFALPIFRLDITRYPLL